MDIRIISGVIVPQGPFASQGTWFYRLYNGGYSSNTGELKDEVNTRSKLFVGEPCKYVSLRQIELKDKDDSTGWWHTFNLSYSQFIDITDTFEEDRHGLRLTISWTANPTDWARVREISFLVMGPVGDR